MFSLCAQTTKTKRSVESLHRIIDAAFSDAPILDRESLSLLRQLRDNKSSSDAEEAATDVGSSGRGGSAVPRSRAALTEFKRKFLLRMRSEFKTPLNNIINASNSVLRLPTASSSSEGVHAPQFGVVPTGERRDALLHVMASAQTLLLNGA